MRVFHPRAAVTAARCLLVPVAAAVLLLPTPASAAGRAVPAYAALASSSATAEPAPAASLSRNAVTNGKRAANSLKAIGAGFGVGLLALGGAMAYTVRRHRRDADRSEP